MKHFRNEETAHKFFMNAAERAKMKSLKKKIVSENKSKEIEPTNKQ